MRREGEGERLKTERREREKDRERLIAKMVNGGVAHSVGSGERERGGKGEMSWWRTNPMWAEKIERGRERKRERENGSDWKYFRRERERERRECI